MVAEHVRLIVCILFEILVSDNFICDKNVRNVITFVWSRNNNNAIHTDNNCQHCWQRQSFKEGHARNFDCDVTKPPRTCWIYQFLVTTEYAGKPFTAFVYT